MCLILRDIFEVKNFTISYKIPIMIKLSCYDLIFEVADPPNSFPIFAYAKEEKNCFVQLEKTLIILYRSIKLEIHKNPFNS